MAKKILIVTKDKMEFQMYDPVARGLESHGYEVIVVAEGLSMEMWVKSGRRILGGLPKEGDFDPNTKVRTDIGSHEALSLLKPDIVMTGLGHPIHLGEKFGLAANSARTKLGYVEDLWGVHNRSMAMPQFVCATDDYGMKQIRGCTRYTNALLGDEYDHLYQNRSPKVYVTGSPAMDALQRVVPDPETKLIIGRNYTNSRVILIGGQDESTTPLIQGLVEASRKHEGWLIIPRFHPKWVSDPSKTAIRDEWITCLYQMERSHRVLWTPPSIDMRSLMLLADEVISIYSNCLIEAVALGAVPISWTSDIGRQKMEEGLGVTTFPSVTLGAAREVRTPEEYLSLGSFSFGREQAREKLGLDGHATKRVVGAIMQELG